MDTLRETKSGIDPEDIVSDIIQSLNEMELNYTTTPPSSYSKIGPNMKDNGDFGTQSIKIEENDVMIEQDVIVSPIRTRVTTVINDNYSPQIVIASDNLGSTQIIKKHL